MPQDAKNTSTKILIWLVRNFEVSLLKLLLVQEFCGEMLNNVSNKSNIVAS